jgi:hypothetical protein
VVTPLIFQVSLVAALIGSAPVFDLCDAREKRFLVDLIQEEVDLMHDRPLPELHTLLLAFERICV